MPYTHISPVSRNVSLLLVCLLLRQPASAQSGPLTVGQGPMPFGSVALSRTQIAFAYAGRIWTVGREGGEAKQATSLPLDRPETEGRPCFSPDGSQLAFWREAGGNVDVFVAPAAGGEARRLTYHPKEDLPLGWSADGKRILLLSRRLSDRIMRLYTIPAAGGNETEIPLPQAEEGALSPDGARVAYLPRWNSTRTWRNYRGGTTTPIWIASLADSRIVDRVPRTDSNDFGPQWVGNSLYFLSDRTFTVNLYRYDTVRKKVTPLTRFEKLDVKSFSAAADAVAFVQHGAIQLLDLKSGTVKNVPVRISADFPETRPRETRAARWVRTFDLSPDGSQALFEARGEVLTLDTKSGEAKNLTTTSGTAERTPAWSPDGKSVAYFSDESGEYALHVRPVDGGAVRKLKIEEKPSFYRDIVWSPDSRRLAFSDKRLALWIADVETGAMKRIDRTTYPGQETFMAAWSPDGRWLAYVKFGANKERAVCLYSLADGKVYSVSDRWRDAEYPVFDRSGRYLYYTASENASPANLFGMSSFPHNANVTRSVYAVVLQKTGRSPLAASPEPGGELTVDVEGIERRQVRLPLPVRNYTFLAAGPGRTLFLVESTLPGGFGSPPSQTLYRFDAGTRALDKLLEGVGGVAVAAEGKTLLAQAGGEWSLLSADAKPGDAPRKLSLEKLSLRVDPRAEWAQMFREVWRVQRDFLYDPNTHGQDLPKLQQTYGEYLPNVVSREGLNTLFQEMVSHISIGHMAVGGGDVPQSRGEGVGVLGADYQIDRGRFRITRIYAGDNSSGLLAGPLAQPGVDARVGDYLLQVDGQEITADRNLFSYFVGKAGRPVRLRVAADPGGREAREVSATPLPGESTLRDWEWVEENRRTVDKLSGGRLGYLYLPDTGTRGYRAFMRDFYAQADKSGLVVDERYNSGGAAADLIAETLARKPLYGYTFREGEAFAFPMGVVPGPRVMIVNEFAGSGGDTLPWMFRALRTGPLVGKRTWGGGIGGYVPTPELLDGGQVASPSRAFYDPATGRWDIENHGVAPDIDVELSPEAWRNGHDTQLEKAVEVAMAALRRNPPTAAKRPVPPVKR